MKRAILGTFILAVIVAAGTLGAVAATDGGRVEERGGLPDLCSQSLTSATMTTLSMGRSWSQPQLPALVLSNEAGNCVVTFDRRTHSGLREVMLQWNGDELQTVALVPTNKLGLIHTVYLTLRADGGYEIDIPEPERQVWWCGLSIGECFLTTGDAFFSHECIEASKDSTYLETYKPGTGPACVAKRYEVD